jgi:hypothetical protein
LACAKSIWALILALQGGGKAPEKQPVSANRGGSELSGAVALL